MTESCSEMLFGPGRLFRGERCTKPVKVHRDGKPWCAIHDPEKVAERLRVSDEKWKLGAYMKATRAQLIAQGHTWASAGW